jgi:peptidoglycan/xylan/chitin deacetylase (PgdA/CDA1 family)
LPVDPAALRVALTFDAEHPDRPGSSPASAGTILDVLDAAGIRASFFVQGRWALAYPELSRRIADAGHLVGNHSHSHVSMPLLSDDGLRTDATDAQTAVMEATGIDPRPWFRCPFGDGHDDPRVLAVLDGLGYRNVHWHVEVEDWEPSHTADDIVRDVLAGVDDQGDGTIVLLHTWPEGTAAALPRIVEGLRDRGAEPVLVDEFPEVRSA